MNIESFSTGVRGNHSRSQRVCQRDLYEQLMMALRSFRSVKTKLSSNGITPRKMKDRWHWGLSQFQQFWGSLCFWELTITGLSLCLPLVGTEWTCGMRPGLNRFSRSHGVWIASDVLNLTPLSTAFWWQLVRERERERERERWLNWIVCTQSV